MTSSPRDRVLRAVEDAVDPLLAFASDLVRIPTVNPPGEAYPACAERITAELARSGFDIERFVPERRPEHTPTHPRVNIVGARTWSGSGGRGAGGGPCVHLNGHYDVVPTGEGWTVDPFGGEIRDGRLWGRGSADMKAGLAAALYAADALRRAGAPLAGTIEVSGTVDEESGGFAGVGHLAEIGRIARGRTDYVVIPEPFGVDRICVGHRGVYWFRVTARGRIAHGSMPFLGHSAIDDLATLITRVRDELAPAIAGRETAMPIVPPEARLGSINVNSVRGGQAGDDEDLGRPSATPSQTPCVADRAEAVFDRRFLIEEPFDDVRGEVVALLAALRAEDPDRDYELTDLMTVHPTVAPGTSPLVGALSRAVEEVVGHPAARVASPGTYDQKHVARIAGVEHCVAYGPGELEQAHQPDESCPVENIVTATKVMALAMLELLTPG